MNKKRNIFLGIGFVLLIVLVALYFWTDQKQQNDAILFKKEYEALNNTIREKDGKKIRSITIEKKNPIIYANEEDIIKKINNKDTFLIYFGFAECPWCRSVLPNLIKAANDLNLTEIYYVDVLEIRDVIEANENKEPITTTKGSDGYYELISLLADVLDDYTIKNGDETISTGEKRIFAPTVVAVVEGKATQATDGISEKQNNGYMKLTEEMNKESYQKFECIIKCITQNSKICTSNKAC